jgi:hypothetical protein
MDAKTFALLGIRTLNPCSLGWLLTASRPLGKTGPGGSRMNSISRTWPTDTMGRVPYWVYSDPDIYAAEMERIWYGPHWLYCGLEAEIPECRRFQNHHNWRTPGHHDPQRPE